MLPNYEAIKNENYVSKWNIKFISDWKLMASTGQPLPIPPFPTFFLPKRAATAGTCLRRSQHQNNMSTPPPFRPSPNGVIHSHLFWVGCSRWVDIKANTSAQRFLTLGFSSDPLQFWVWTLARNSESVQIWRTTFLQSFRTWHTFVALCHTLSQLGTLCDYLAQFDTLWHPSSHFDTIVSLWNIFSYLNTLWYNCAHFVPLWQTLFQFDSFCLILTHFVSVRHTLEQFGTIRHYLAHFI